MLACLVSHMTLRSGMGMRIRVLAGCFGMGVTALLLTGTAAQAAPQSGAHVSAAVSLSDNAGGGGGNGNGGGGGGNGNWSPTPTWSPTHKCKPKPKPTPTHKCKPKPTPTPTPTAEAEADSDADARRHGSDDTVGPSRPPRRAAPTRAAAAASVGAAVRWSRAAPRSRCCRPVWVCSPSAAGARRPPRHRCTSLATDASHWAGGPSVPPSPPLCCARAVPAWLRSGCSARLPMPGRLTPRHR